ncbi:MAG: hypothetical protein JSS61_07185 [Verrucomicrobia bacterium]|nr:hypothetical protein [Verrucomicrobiota bacterium]
MSAVASQPHLTTAQGIVAGCSFKHKYQELSLAGKVTRVVIVAALIVGLAKIAFALLAAIWFGSAALAVAGIVAATLFLALEILSRVEKTV